MRRTGIHQDSRTSLLQIFSSMILNDLLSFKCQALHRNYGDTNYVYVPSCLFPQIEIGIYCTTSRRLVLALSWVVPHVELRCSLSLQYSVYQLSIKGWELTSIRMGELIPE